MVIENEFFGKEWTQEKVDDYISTAEFWIRPDEDQCIHDMALRLKESVEEIVRLKNEIFNMKQKMGRKKEVKTEQK